jgi:hypothetical protein
VGEALRLCPPRRYVLSGGSVIVETRTETIRSFRKGAEQ